MGEMDSPEFTVWGFPRGLRTHLGGTCFSSWSVFLVFLTAASSTFDEGMPCETRDCHEIRNRNRNSFVWQSLRQSPAYPFVLFLPLIRKTHKRLPMEEKQKFRPWHFFALRGKPSLNRGNQITSAHPGVRDTKNSVTGSRLWQHSRKST